MSGGGLGQAEDLMKHYLEEKKYKQQYLYDTIVIKGYD